MSDPLGSPQHVSPLVRSSTHAPSTTRQSPAHAPSSPRPEEPERQIAQLQNRHHGPARTQTPPPSSSSPSETPSTTPSEHPPPAASAASPPKPARRHRPDAPPQLSERDDIFATHYLAGDSSTSTPVLSSARPAKTGPVNQDVVAGISLPAPISSGAGISSSLHSSYTGVPHKMHMAPEHAPYSTSPAPPLSRAGVKDLVDEPTPASRLGTPVGQDDKEDWDRAKEKDRSRPSGRRHRSDEQIQATLANEEALGQVRSRKASHYLGLFRENAKEKKQQRKSRDRLRDVNGATDDEQQEDQHDLDNGQHVGESEVQNEVSGTDDGKHAQADATRSLSSQTPISDSAAALSPRSERREPVQIPDENVEWFSEGAQSGTYPIRLLEEIRAHPVAQQHAKEKHGDSPPSETSSKTKPQPLAPVTEGRRTSNVERALILPQEAEAEAEDSDKEHISAATYFPHQAPSPDDIHGQDKSGDAFDDLGDPAISPRTDPATASRPEQSVEKFQLDQDHVTARDVERKKTKAPEGISTDDLFTGPRRVNTGLSTVSETDYESLDDDPEDVDELADVEHTPTATPRVRPVRVKKAARRARSPLGAVELKPYKHQVGGHTKVFSFSKQAICKELNNKENQFYEVIERRHPELLDFMPRYLGVLNVTYTKAKRKQQPATDDHTATETANGASNGSAEQKTTEAEQPQERVISHSKNFSQPDETIARVIYANNMHIIPSNLFPNLPILNGVRPQTADGAIDASATNGLEKPSNGVNVDSSESPKKSSHLSRPKLSDYPSWGATTVNHMLKERVLRDVFSPPPVHAKHYKRSRKPLTDESFDNPALARSESLRQSRPSNKDALLSAALLKSASDLTPLGRGDDPYRGGSAPTHHSSFSNLRDRSSVDSNASNASNDSNASAPGLAADRHISRRRSDQGLQRLQRDIDTAERSELNYFEDEEFARNIEEPMFDMEEQKARRASIASKLPSEPMSKVTPLGPATTNGEIIAESAPLTQTPSRDVPKTEASVPAPFPAPVNPLQAQLLTDERVRHFLLLEDLTANMVKPCVLDLKMGTRQYGIEANAKKRVSQKKKCSMTTSRQLGVRLCGMQVWNVKKQEYVFEDKYAGRDLSAGKEFQAALRRFLYDGVSSKSVTRHIPVLLDKLARLEQIVSQLPRYRFYASSLLLIYDGADLPSQKGMERGGRVDVELTEEEKNDAASAEKAKGSVATSNIDIRLVDFANCVTSQTKRLADAPSPPAHPNMPDRGYVKGLRSLRSYFQRIWMEINTEEAGSWVERGEGEAMAIAQKGAGNADQPEGWRKAGENQDDAGEHSS